MGFYNVQQGDVPYFKQLADTYSMSDNYHQAVNGGTGANHIMLGTGDAIWFSDGNGNPARRRTISSSASAARTRASSTRSKIRIPLPATNNWYTEDGYGGGSYGSPSYGGGTYSDCADSTQPGVPAVRQLPARRCNHQPELPSRDIIYLLNNYNPGYFGDGTNAYVDSTRQPRNDRSRPCSRFRRRACQTSATPCWKSNISFAYFGDQFNAYLANPLLNYVAPDNTYCNICNFFQYSTSIMTNAPVRQAALKDTTDLYDDLQSRQSCRRCRLSSPTAISTAIRHRQRSICSKALSKRSSI